MTARIEGISAIGTSDDLVKYGPAGDAEILTYGELVTAPLLPMDPSLGPTPAMLVRAVCDRLDEEIVVLDGGIWGETAAPTVDVEASPGSDIREATDAVPNAAEIFSEGRAFAEGLSRPRVVVGETVPGGTTTAQAVFTALGYEEQTSSSFAEQNPTELKRHVVDTALTRSGLASRDDPDPLGIVRSVGDPVQAAILGLLSGVAGTDTDIMLAGGTQMLAIAALAREMGITTEITVATTEQVRRDPSVDLRRTADKCDVALRINDPTLPDPRHPAMRFFGSDLQKEGVGMGGALELLAENDLSLADVADRIKAIHDPLLESHPEFSYDLE
ncbi:nicotinate-nucleotide--dimethylbenzimidazole phosphoribosyltransferase [Halosimplex marinum]|uniref:nicotinate-nucleotide--dimethylbenzimidazole phosphoribosyltransferase n=1 Tax=Halosimplex marinum TaxID=3396620 RepID=UPI003F55F838